MSTIKVNNIQSRTGNAISFTSGDTITIPSGATLTNNGTANGLGKIGQVQSTTLNTRIAFTSTSYVDVSGLSVNITPTSTSSKILIFVKSNACSINTTYNGVMRLMRDSVNIGNDETTWTYKGFGNLRRNSGGADSVDISMMYLDSPNTLSQINYHVEAKVEGDTFYINGVNSTSLLQSASNITVMEVLA